LLFNLILKGIKTNIFVLYIFILFNSTGLFKNSSRQLLLYLVISFFYEGEHQTKSYTMFYNLFYPENIKRDGEVPLFIIQDTLIHRWWQSFVASSHLKWIMKIYTEVDSFQMEIKHENRHIKNLGFVLEYHTSSMQFNVNFCKKSWNIAKRWNSTLILFPNRRPK